MAYGEEIEVSLFHYERPEVRFSGLDALKEQLKKDTLACVTYFEERGNDGKKEGSSKKKRKGSGNGLLIAAVLLTILFLAGVMSLGACIILRKTKKNRRPFRQR